MVPRDQEIDDLVRYVCYPGVDLLILVFGGSLLVFITGPHIFM